MPDSGCMLLTVRPERLRLSPPDHVRSGVTVWRGRVDRVVYLGSRSEVHLLLADGSAAMVVAAKGVVRWQAGDEADAWFTAEDAWTVPAEPLA